MLVSVIIPNLNSPTVDQTLASLRAQSLGLKDVEVLVVGLDEPGLVQEDGLVRMISTGRAVSAAAARNIGLQQGTGHYLLFTDADCVVAPDWMERLLAGHERGHGVVGGAVSFDADNFWTLCDNVSMFHEFLPTTQGGPRPYLPTLNLSVRRDIADEIGPFDESFPGASGEDIDWTVRMRKAGYELHFDPQAIVYHRPQRGSLRRVLAHWWRSGQSMVRVRLRYADVFGTPALMRSRLALVALSPLIALAVTVRIFWRDRSLLRYLHTLPVVYVTKVAWCLGAARQLKRIQTSEV